jgi:hypothetical protein
LLEGREALARLSGRVDVSAVQTGQWINRLFKKNRTPPAQQNPAPASEMAASSFQLRAFPKIGPGKHRTPLCKEPKRFDPRFFLRRVVFHNPTPLIDDELPGSSATRKADRITLRQDPSSFFHLIRVFRFPPRLSDILT